VESRLNGESDPATQEPFRFLSCEQGLLWYASLLVSHLKQESARSSSSAQSRALSLVDA